MENKKRSRRDFVKKAGVISAGFIGLQSLIASQFLSCTPTSTNSASTKVGPDVIKYGPLKNDPAGIIKLPANFSYKIIARAGQKMSDGLIHPDKPDGMATFAASDGRVIIVRNHELMPDDQGPFGKDNELMDKIDEKYFYDKGTKGNPAQGGTTTLIFNEDTQEVEESFLSLAGTLRNCAGGPTPWNSWITCEEIVSNPGQYDMEKAHGYCFEVPATETAGLAEPIPLKAMGKFNHEAICVDPRTGIVYLTEDAHDGLLYRFLPNEKGNMRAGGRLQALAIKGDKSADTRNWEESPKPCIVNQVSEVEWLDMENIDPDVDDLRLRGAKKGAAVFARGEGMWFGDNEFYFACTNGGANKTGQVFRYKPGEHEGTDQEHTTPGTVELFLEPNDTKILKYCDNLTVAPWGDVILCEDDSHPFVVGVTPKGEYYKLAENIGYQSEFTGGVFSPSGKTYFVNIQHAGLTLAIQGNWLMES